MAGGRLRIGWLAAGVVACAAPALAAPASFPTNLDAETLTGWLKRETDITPVQVVAVSPSAVTAVISVYPISDPRGARVVVRAEAVSAEAHAREGVLSWHVSVSADCAGHKVRLGETTGYLERNLIGSGRAIRPAETDWRIPQGGTPLDSIWRLACQAGFQRPLAPGAETVAMPKPAEPPPPPRSPPPVKVAAPERPPVPRPAAAGGAVVQIGASPSEALARADLDAAARKFSTLLAGRPLRVERAEVNGRTVFRAVVAGFATAADAPQLCAALKAGGLDCFVRKQ